MSLPKLMQIGGLADDVARLQTSLQTWVAQLGRMNFWTGVDLTNEADASGNVTNGVAFTAGTQKAIKHKLGRIPTKCYVTRFLSGGATWFESQTADVNFVYLKFSANCSVYLRVE